MKIIIVGAGKVGVTIAENLSAENHDVTVIDTNNEVLGKVSDTLDVLCLRGNGASIGVLRSAGVDKCDMLIAATDRDELNMVCCLTAKKLGAKYTVARIRDYVYAQELIQLKTEMDIDMVVNPENSTARQISRLLRYPEARDVETFCRGKVELIGIRVEKDDVLLGGPLSVLKRRLGNLPILFCAVRRGAETIIPNGDTSFLEGDKVYVIGEPVNMSRFFRVTGRQSHKIKSAVIVGGGRISVYLAELLAGTNIDVKIVERDRSKCVELCEVLPKTMIINGDGTDQDLLVEENLTKAGAFVSLTGDDEANMITSLYAKQIGVHKAIAKVNRQSYYGIIDSLNIDSVISPKVITAYAILKVIRGMQDTHGSKMETLYSIADGGAEAIEFEIGGDAPYLGVPLKDLRIKKGIILAVIVRRGQDLEGGR